MSLNSNLMHRFEHFVYARIKYLFRILVTILNEKYIISHYRPSLPRKYLYLSYQNDTRTIKLNSKYYSYDNV